jgi:hypothetical protein
MKSKLLLPPLVVLSLSVFCAVSALSQTVITFDDINTALPGHVTNIPSGYQGLSWSNFNVVNAILEFNSGYRDGYYYGMVSPSNVAFNGLGHPAEIDSPGTNFNFLSTYLTGAWNSNLNIEVEGFNGTNLLYDQTVVASATNPTLFTFNYMDIDRLYFDSYGGEPAFTPASEYEFVMDNFTFEFVPEPSSLLLAALGAVSLVVFLRRRRT